MRVLLMNVSDIHVGKTSDDWDLEASDIGAFPPMGILYLAGAVRAAGRHEVSVLDCILDRLTPEQVVERVKAYNADVVGFTVYTPNLYDALVISRKVRQALPGVTLVWGGPHTMLFPAESMAHPEVDFLITGEAEETFPAFLDAQESGADMGHILENVVYLELLRRGYEVYIGKIGTAEVDFIAIGAEGCEYYQVSQTVMEEQTLKRELAPLDSIKDHNPKYLLTMDYTPKTSYNGIKQINVLDWLLDSPS